MVSSEACVLNPSSMVPNQPDYISGHKSLKRKLNSSAGEEQVSFQEIHTCHVA